MTPLLALIVGFTLGCLSVFALVRTELAALGPPEGERVETRSLD